MDPLTIVEYLPPHPIDRLLNTPPNGELIARFNRPIDHVDAHLVHQASQKHPGDGFTVMVGSDQATFTFVDMTAESLNARVAGAQRVLADVNAASDETRARFAAVAAQIQPLIDDLNRMLP